MKNFAMLMVALGATAAFHFASAGTAQAMNRAEVRQQIRSMPITERPNRPGHFYGNNVRRVHNMRSG